MSRNATKMTVFSKKATSRNAVSREAPRRKVASRRATSKKVAREEATGRTRPRRRRRAQPYKLIPHCDRPRVEEHMMALLYAWSYVYRPGVPYHPGVPYRAMRLHLAAGLQRSVVEMYRIKKAGPAMTREVWRQYCQKKLRARRARRQEKKIVTLERIAIAQVNEAQAMENGNLVVNEERSER